MNLNNVSLVSEYNERTSADRNRLGSDFKKVLIDTFERNWLVKDFMPSLFTAAELDGIAEEEVSDEDRESQTYKNRKAVEDKINFNVRSIGIEIVEDLSITGEVGQTMIRNKAKYVRTMQELDAAYMAFCAKEQKAI